VHARKNRPTNRRPPHATAQLLHRCLSMWFIGTREELVRRLMRLLLTRPLLAARHPATGETYKQVCRRQAHARAHVCV
jgi:hypothetical protein